METHLRSKSIPLIIAHRGASFDAPENTLAAFAEAWQQGADGIEGDYCLTVDRQIVCIHDEDTARTGGKQLVVSDSTLEQLRSLEYGSWKGTRFAGERLPLLQEVLERVPDNKWCVIELKSGPDIVAVLQAVLEHSPIRRDKLLIIAFDESTILEAKIQLPSVKAHWLTDFQQHTNGSWTPSVEQILAILQRTGADGLGLENNPKVVTESFAHSLRQGGANEFHVWTVDEPEQAAYYSRLGVWGLTTNRPAFLRKCINHLD